MAKTKSSRGKSGKKREASWSNEDHDARTAKRIASLNKRKRRKHEHRQSAPEGKAAATPRDESATGGSGRPTGSLRHEQPLHQSRPKKKSRRPRLASRVPGDHYKRSFLSHDRVDQIDASKLRLATAQVQRKVAGLKERLEQWDPVEEARSLAAQRTEDVEQRMQREAEHRRGDRQAREKAAGEYSLLHARHGVNSSTHRRKANLKKNPRPRPESWKLRGAARPAWEVYDFDTRYVDVHLKAKEEANEKARRVKNVFVLCQGRFGLNDDDDDGSDGDVHTSKANNKYQNQRSQPFRPPQPHCREYLSLLTRLGALQLHRGDHAAARRSYLDAINLEGPARPHSITNARPSLMNLYLAANRPSSARRLWNLLENDDSAWVRYAAALVEYVSWNLLHEEGSSAAVAERALARAVRGNVYVAYLLGWPQMFERAMEYTHEVVEQGCLDSKSGSLLEAIEYGCCSYSSGQPHETGEEKEEEGKGINIWIETEGSLDWVRSVILRALTTDSEEDEDRVTKKDLLGWETRLSGEEAEHEQQRAEKERLCQETDGGKDRPDNDSDDEEEEEPDVVMFAGMFRTAMDWLQDAGEFLKEPSFDYLTEPDVNEACSATNDDMTRENDDELKGSDNFGKETGIVNSDSGSSDLED